MDTNHINRKNQQDIRGQTSSQLQVSNVDISESWARCRNYGLHSSGRPIEAVVSSSQMTNILEQNHYIRQLVIPELELLYNQIAGTNFMVAYADNNGIVLDSLQDVDFQAGEGGKTVIPGSMWMEQVRGTNALGLALHNAQAQIVTGGDHFFKKFGDLSCFASPIFDYKEDIVGVIDATSDATARNHHTLALVKLAARNIENRLFVEQFSTSLILSFHARHEYLTTTSVALIAVDNSGFIQGANANAKAMLSGLDLSSRHFFSDVFSLKFSTIIDELRANAIIQIRDIMGSEVFMTVQHSVLARVLSVPDTSSVRHQRATAHLPKNISEEQQPLPRTSVTKVFEDEILVCQMAVAVQSLKIGLPVLIEGDRGTGRTSLARELQNQYLADQPFVTIDCNLLTADNFDSESFGNQGRSEFFQDNAKTGLSGKLYQGRDGTVFFDNIDMLPPHLLRIICQIMSSEEQRCDLNITAIKGFLFSAKSGWLATDCEEDAFDEFAEAVHGCHVQIPSLSERTDFQKVAQAITADLSPQHCLSKVAITGLRTDKWSGNLRQLRKTLQLAIANAPETVIREDINSALPSSRGRAPTPCPKCANSPVRAESCVSIQKTWLKTGQNVSLVARRLGVSRNTVYKHIEKQDTP